MRKRLLKASILIIIIAALLTSLTFAKQNREKEQVVSGLIIQTLNYLHYHPAAIDDQLSKKAFQQYLKSLDPNKRFFMQNDINQLKHYQFQIDNQLTNGSTQLMDTATHIIKERIQKAQTLTSEFENHPLDFSINETVENDPERKAYSQNQQEFHKLWYSIFKARTLETYFELLEKKSKGKSLSLTAKFNPKLESEARHKVARSMKSSLIRLLKSTREDGLEIYLNSILACYDPHTSYFPPRQKEDFDISMSGTLEGIGAMLLADGEYVKVEQIVPGSPAWRQKDLKAGDLILKVGEGVKEAVDIANMPIEDVVRHIRGKKGTEVHLTVKKPDGQIKTIAIVRDVVVIEESYARSAVVYNPKTHKKMGYISLPSFYRDFNSKDARSSAEDVHKELLKLNKQKVTGVILDLRNNAGGSLEDAVDMTGLFIKEGPVVQTRDKAGKIQVYEDSDPSIVSKVPVVVLVNSLSASASEILAAALQDYHRAVIVGSPDTFGKGSVQSLLELDRFLTNDYAKFRPAGSLKLTTQKYYRITGGSVQFKGVQSDIVLPDPYEYLKLGEEHLDNALSWDTIASLRYQKWNHKVDLNKLQQHSALRLKNSSAFQLVNSTIARVKKESNNTEQTLNFREALKERINANRQSKLLNRVQTKSSQIKVTANLPKTKQNNEWVKQLNNDIYLEEASFILSDLINQQ